MSLINKMLQELDRRNAMGATAVPPQQVRAVSAPGSGHEWFWRSLALLAAIAVGWVGWVAFQVQPRPLATELALKSDDPARRKPAAAPVAAAPAPAPEPAPKARDVSASVAPPQAPAETTIAASPPTSDPAPQPTQARVEGQSAPAPELFKLALSIDRPIQPRPRPVARPGAPPKPEPSKLAGSIRVSKTEIPAAPAAAAENLFRHGVTLLNQGRPGQAMDDFAAALAKHPGHEASRQALIALRIERRELEDARRLLEEGLALNPAQTQFASVLARVLVERGDYAGAANVLSASQGTGAKDAEFQLLQGAVLQRLGRHAEALESFQRAAGLAEQPGTTWVAMGISFEATGRKDDALKAYRQSLNAGLAAHDVRAYAETRIRALN